MARTARITVLLLAAAALGACGYSDPGSGPSAGTTVPSTPTTVSTVSPVAGADDFHAGEKSKGITLPDGLSWVDLTTGTGAQPKSGDKVTVHYTGWLTDGTKFDSSRDRGAPFPFTIGQGQVIPGWDEGVLSMHVGGKRRLTVPPALAYRDQAQGSIPANSTLVFDIEMIDVGPGPSPSPSPIPTADPGPTPAPAVSP